MKLQNMGVLISDIPALHSIQVMPDGNLILTNTSDEACTLTRQEAEEVREALSVAISAARGMEATATVPSPPESLIGQHLTEENAALLPTGSQVRDNENDFYTLTDDGKWGGCSLYWMFTDGIGGKYAPYTITRVGKP